MNRRGFIAFLGLDCFCLADVAGLAPDLPVKFLIQNTAALVLHSIIEKHESGEAFGFGLLDDTPESRKQFYAGIMENEFFDDLINKNR